MRASLEIHAAKMRQQNAVDRRREHGRLKFYNRGCRCCLCRRANTRYSYWYRYESM